MHSQAWSSSEQVIASIVNESRCGMSDVAFRTAPPIGGIELKFDSQLPFKEKVNFQSRLDSVRAIKRVSQR